MTFIALLKAEAVRSACIGPIYCTLHRNRDAWDSASCTQTVQSKYISLSLLTALVLGTHSSCAKLVQFVCLDCGYLLLTVLVAARHLIKGCWCEFTRTPPCGCIEVREKMGSSSAVVLSATLVGKRNTVRPKWLPYILLQCHHIFYLLQNSQCHVPLQWGGEENRV